MNNIKRGEMFYISRGGVSYSGSEQHSDRPAVVVSNDKNNENSNVVERERLMIIQDRCMKQCRQGASDFGLTVSSRCRLVVPKPQQQKPENKFAKYAN